jgi:3-deoxy-D-manno-octulosonate 8-phosphate phosphatase KdsC-like HAD superfamily phosphatase
MNEWILPIVISLFASFMIYKAFTAAKRYKAVRKKLEDLNIEWYGEGIDLKKKNYPEMKDDHREKVSHEQT